MVVLYIFCYDVILVVSILKHFSLDLQSYIECHHAGDESDWRCEGKSSSYGG